MKPRAITLLFGLVPFLAMCFSVSFWDSNDPRPSGIATMIVSGCRNDWNAGTSRQSYEIRSRRS